MTKAQEIYGATRYECIKHIGTFGYELNPDGQAVGFNFVITEKVVCTRTLNAMEKILNSERSQIKMSLKYGIIDQNRFDDRTKVLNMVESTINNTRKAIA